MAIKKSKDARSQLHVWSKLLEGRIALQKVVVASRELDNTEDEQTIKYLTKLLSCLVRLRNTYRRKSQFSLGNEPEEVGDINDELLDKEHGEYTDIRNGLIEKWYEKTKIGTIPKKGYAAMELPTMQLVQNALKDKDRLIRRTQLDRTSHLDDAIHPETFNDDDFYHQLLKEVISKDEGRKWVELQRLKYKVKRKAETKASKGRKIKKDLIPKLVNFMAPCRPANSTNKEPMQDQIRNELLRSIFGGRTKHKHDKPVDVSP